MAVEEDAPPEDAASAECAERTAACVAARGSCLDATTAHADARAARRRMDDIQGDAVGRACRAPRAVRPGAKEEGDRGVLKGGSNHALEQQAAMSACCF